MKLNYSILTVSFVYIFRPTFQNFVIVVTQHIGSVYLFPSVCLIVAVAVCHQFFVVIVSLFIVIHINLQLNMNMSNIVLL